MIIVMSPIGRTCR